MSTPIRIDHVGSLVRPPALKAQRELLTQGKIAPDDPGFIAAEDAAVAHVVALQRELRLASITDGEMRREVFFEGFFEKLDGVVPGHRPIAEFWESWADVRVFKAIGLETFSSVYVNGKIKRNKPIFKDEFLSVKALIAPEEVSRIKITCCPPTWFHHLHGSKQAYDQSVYKNDEEYFADLAIAYQEEFKELYDLGCRNIQIDEPTFCSMYHPESAAMIRADGIEIDDLRDKYVRAINACTKGRPKDLNIGLHICRGNFRGNHFHTGDYEPMAEVLFRDLDVDTFYLEFDDERSGSFQPLRHFPPNKKLVLGVVTTKRPTLEDPEEIKLRIHQAVDVLASGIIPRTKEEALNQISISPQCGFASDYLGNPVTEQDVRAKVGLMAKIAKDIWG